MNDNAKFTPGPYRREGPLMWLALPIVGWVHGVGIIFGFWG